MRSSTTVGAGPGTAGAGRAAVFAVVVAEAAWLGCLAWMAWRG